MALNMPLINDTVEHKTALFYTLSTRGDEIKAIKEEELTSESSSVHLSCSYSSAFILQWYRQFPGSAPQFLVLISAGAKAEEKSEVDSRFMTKVTKAKEENRVDLMISSVAVSDSAVYYCAVRPTASGNRRALNINLTEQSLQQILFSYPIYSVLSADEIRPNTGPDIISTEGERVTLSCSYDSSWDSVQLLWYRRYLNNELQYLMWKGARSFTNAGTPADQRFQSTTSHTSTELIITDLSLSDSALYYCALRVLAQWGPLTWLSKRSRSEDTVNQPSKLMTETEGKTVTLDCKYTTSSTAPELFWYIQRTGESLKLVLQRNSYGGGINGTEFRNRFHSELKASTVPLVIEDGHVSDSAVYYCALRPTVFTEALPLHPKQSEIRRYPQGELEYLLSKGARSWNNREHRSDERFESTTSYSLTSLSIPEVALSDSALYYCAMMSRLYSPMKLLPVKEHRRLKSRAERGCNSRESVEQIVRVQSAVEGTSVIISCTYETSDSSPYLFWYQQTMNRSPKYMMSIFSTTVLKDDFVEERFQVNYDKSSKSVPLTIKNLHISDSAVYYCALRPTETQRHHTL
ncbi:hypothetical protein DNTS_029945 [Danionella cerebrum]|uniref:Ig-like domain-containing protein n=1 Tax=Danionella cerebrum TaxID=2873325 RepID=A0A553RQ06_9TELE|nr:hypothetical protein DNTS_029945 [Danionella translucida]